VKVTACDILFIYLFTGRACPKFQLASMFIQLSINHPSKEKLSKTNGTQVPLLRTKVYI